MRVRTLAFLFVLTSSTLAIDQQLSIFSGRNLAFPEAAVVAVIRDATVDDGHNLALAGFAFWVAGIDGAAFWGTIMAILSIVPGIGAALIWVPAVIYLIVTGQLLAGLLLFAWCSAVVGTIDNILRPILVGKDAWMPDLLILVGTLRGLFLFGPIGFIVGPIVCGLFLTVWDIYGTTFQDLLPLVKSLQSGIVNKSDSEA